MEELKDNIKREISNLFTGWDFEDIVNITANIIDEVVEDVVETSDYPNYNDSDIRIAIKRVVVNLLGIGK